MTRFSMGFFDSVFGEKVDFFLKDENGNDKKVVVTKKWMENAEAKKQISQKMNITERASGLISHNQNMVVVVYSDMLDKYPLFEK